MSGLADWAFIWLEGNVILLFVLHLLHAWRRGVTPTFVLLSAALYGYILEQGDISLFHSYAYNPDLHGFIGFVPLILPLAWAMIIYGAMLLTDRLGITGGSAPFADALWAVLLDLGFDAIAIRLGLWQWNISMEDGYFGVPAGNFYSWIAVSFFFALFTRILRRRWSETKPGVQFAVPVVAYPAFLLSVVPFVVVSEAIYENPAPRGLGIELVALTLIAFSTIVAFGLRQRTPSQPADFLTAFTRWSIHLTFLSGFILAGLQRQFPFLLFMSLMLLGVEFLLLRSLAPMPRPLSIFPQPMSERVAKPVTMLTPQSEKGRR
ncbi:MAG: carotenoid biosynthesis protein [Chloroflexi bacterium]|nr:carotenoid biosynthesis protein [Chloroflexota bacterium]